MTDRELMQMAENTDRELWRERDGDFYADSIHVTKDGRIGMNVGGTVFVMPIKAWHEAAALRDRLAQPEREWVGLTDDEIEEGQKASWVDQQAFESAVWWAEAKLKEKNT